MDDIENIPEAVRRDMIKALEVPGSSTEKLAGVGVILLRWVIAESLEGPKKGNYIHESRR
jgi:hypothetical protein